MVITIDLYEYFHIEKTTEKGILHCYFHEDELERDCVLVIPGGAYSGCCFRENKPIVQRLYQEGFHAAYLEYTCDVTAKYPLSFTEGVMSVIYLRQQCAKRTISLSKLLVMGFSAGGHLAGHIANAGKRLSEISCLSEEEKTFWKVDGAVYAYPVVSAKEGLIHEGSFQNLLKEEFQTKREAVSLENWIDENSPPCFIFHCADDSVVPVGNSLLLAEKHIEKGIPCQLHIFPKGGHGVALPTEECWLKTEMGMVNQDLIIWWELFKKWEEKL